MNVRDIMSLWIFKANSELYNITDQKSHRPDLDDFSFSQENPAFKLKACRLHWKSNWEDPMILGIDGTLWPWPRQNRHNNQRALVSNSKQWLVTILLKMVQKIASSILWHVYRFSITFQRYPIDLDIFSIIFLIKAIILS